MTDAGAAVGMYRLPWLEDEPAPRAQLAVRPPTPARAPRTPRPSGSMRELAGWVVASILLVAGGSYWLGMQSADQAAPGRSAPASARPEATVKLPEARTTPAAPDGVDMRGVAPTPAPIVSEPRAERPVRGERATRRRTLKPMQMRDSELSKAVSEQEGAAAKPESAKPAAESAPVKVLTPPAARPLASRQQLRLWPARVSKGASGRLVQIGAFGSRQQAKLGWRRMKRSYPAVARLPAVVVEARNSRGRRFYRFQIGTTSQAHSEVLCQRMESIRFSCAVVGLPWKSKVER